HPYIKGHYLYFPRDSQAAATRLDGRWMNRKTGQPIAPFVTGPCYGKPIGIMATDKLALVQMADPDTCGAIGITYSSDEENDSIRRHNAVYITLFGEDLEPGEKRQGRIRQKLIKGKVELGSVLDLYENFHNTK